MTDPFAKNGLWAMTLRILFRYVAQPNRVFNSGEEKPFSRRRKKFSEFADLTDLCYCIARWLVGMTEAGSREVTPAAGGQGIPDYSTGLILQAQPCVTRR